MTGGMLMASGDDSVMFRGVPEEVPAPVQMLVPGCRTTPERPGSSVKEMLAGARPLDCWYTSAELPGETTAKVRRPWPRLLILRVPEATPRLQSSWARKTCVVSGCRIG